VRAHVGRIESEFALTQHTQCATGARRKSTMAFDHKVLAQAVISNLGQAGSGAVKSEIEELVYSLVGEGINSIPKAANFLAKFPKLSRRVGAVALLNVLKADPNVFGAGNAPYVRALNEVIESFAEGVGRSVADVEFTDETGHEMAVEVEKIGRSEAIVARQFTIGADTDKIVTIGKPIAHRGDGRCTELVSDRARWLIRYPSKSIGGGKDKPSRTTPGDPYPEVLMSLAGAMEQADPCLICMKKFVMQPTWARPAEPPKPRAWHDAYDSDQKVLLSRLPRLFGEDSADILEFLEEAPAVFIQPVLDRFAKGRGKNRRLEPKEEVVKEIRDALFAWTSKDKTARDRIETVFKTWFDRNTIVDGRSVLQTAEEKAKKAYDHVKWLAAIVSLALMVVLAVGWYEFFAGWIYGDIKPLLFGTFVLPVMSIIMSLVPKAVDYVMDNFRALLRYFNKNVKYVDSLKGLYDFTLNAALFIALFGIACAVVIGVLGNGELGVIGRVVVALAALITMVTAARWGFDVNSKWKKIVLTFVVVPILLIGAATFIPTMFFQKWQTLEGSGEIVKQADGTYQLEKATVETSGLLVDGLPMEQVFHSNTDKVSWNKKTGRYTSKEELVVDLPGAIIEPVKEGKLYTYRWMPDLGTRLSKSFLGKVIGLDGWTRGVLYDEKSSDKKEDAASVESSTLAQHMWGHTHWFWAKIIIASLAAALGGGVGLMFLGAQDASQSGVVRGFRSVGAFVAFVAILGGLAVALCLSVPLGVDWIFGFGEPETPSAQVEQTQPPAVAAPPPASDRRASGTSSSTSKDTGRKMAEASGSWLTKDVCLSLPDDVLRMECLAKL